MSATQSLVHEAVQVVNLIPPAQNDSAVDDGPLIHLGTTKKLAIVCVSGAVTTPTKIELKQLKADKSGSKVLGFDTIYHNAADVDSPVLVKDDPSGTNEHTISTTDKTITVIEIEPHDLDVDNDFCLVRCNITADGSTCFCGIVGLLMPMVYDQSVNPITS